MEGGGCLLGVGILPEGCRRSPALCVTTPQAAAQPTSMLLDPSQSHSHSRTNQPINQAACMYVFGAALPLLCGVHCCTHDFGCCGNLWVSAGPAVSYFNLCTQLHERQRSAASARAGARVEPQPAWGRANRGAAGLAGCRLRCCRSCGRRP